MNDKIALVTGSSRGIGRDIALKLADATSGVAVHYKNNREAAEKVVKKIREKGKFAACFRADLTKEKEALALIRKVDQNIYSAEFFFNLPD